MLYLLTTRASRTPRNVRHLPLSLTWEPLNIGDTEGSIRSWKRLHRILKSWENTGYAAGQGHRGVGTDCVRSVVLILGEWCRHETPDIATLPPDASLHCRVSAIESMRAIIRSLPSSQRVLSRRTQPGDVLIVGPAAGGPGHAIIVGPEKNTLWQTSSSSGFNRCGWTLTPGSRVFEIRRFLDLSTTI